MSASSRYLRGRLAGAPEALRAKIVPRLVGADRPGLVPDEADLVLVVDVYHHLEDRADWLRALLAGMKPGAELVIVDFKKGDFSDAPPEELRLAPGVIAEELKAAGFVDLKLDEALLPRQYLVRARTPSAP